MTQRDVEITTPDGRCPAALFIPDANGPCPSIIMFVDAGGMRDTMRTMGARLSDEGYVVLVPDIFYRLGPYEPIDLRTAFASKESAEKVMAMIHSYTPDMASRDAVAFSAYLDTLPEARRGAMGTTGYCMGGRLSLIAAESLGDRIQAAASFHGGNLANPDDPASPHRHIDMLAATVYVAGAIDDQSFPDDQKELLEATLTAADIPHTIETYDARHGFAVPDNPSFDRAASERHWAATTAFFGSVLRS